VSERGLRKSRTGFVVSDAMDQSVVVQVSRTVLHPLYKKYIRKRKRYMAHDAENQYRTGDKVKIVETRPLSKNKHWRVTEKVT